MKYFKSILRSGLVLFLILPLFLIGGNKDENLEPALDSIRPIDVYNYCKTISSEKFAGRLTGHEGYTAAARWAADKFREWDLLPVSSKDGYLQPYPSPYTIIKSAAMTFILTGNEGQVKLSAGKDFLPLLYSDSGNTRAGLVFAGWGISAPELGYDDYAGIDAKEKFVLCFRGTPDRSNSAYAKHDHHRHRMKTVRNKGALGLFYIYSEPVANPNGEWLEGFTPAIISEDAADKLLKEKSLNSKSLKKELRTTKKPRSFSLNSEVKYIVDSEHFPGAVGYNVAGYIEGSDPELNKQCLVIGGHFDHCGLHMGYHFPGANDNASGSAAVMEIAEAFSKLGKKPKRSVIFVLFGGEEMGLMGSYYFADHLPAQFEAMDAMFNFDMVGEGDGAVVGVQPDPPEFEQTLREADRQVGTLKRTFFIRQVGVRSSDYAPFFLKGARCMSFFSNGPHLHYHKTGDTIYRINPDIMADISKLAFLTGFAWADR